MGWFVWVEEDDDVFYESRITLRRSSWQLSTA